MKDYQLTKHNLQEMFDLLQDELEKNPVLVVNSQSGSTGPWGMARLWRGWMEKIGTWMAGQGAVMRTRVIILAV